VVKKFEKFFNAPGVEIGLELFTGVSTPKAKVDIGLGSLLWWGWRDLESLLWLGPLERGSLL